MYCIDCRDTVHIYICNGNVEISRIKVLNLTHFRQDVQSSIVNLCFPPQNCSGCYLFYRVIKMVLYYSHDVSTFDHFLIIGF